jgi:hypothetical protein
MNNKISLSHFQNRHGSVIPAAITTSGEIMNTNLLFKFAISLIITAGSLTAFANKTIQCDELRANNYGSQERFVLEINEKDQLVSMDESSWKNNWTVNTGGGTYGYYEKSPLVANANGSNLIYKFRTQDAGDGDFSGPSTLVSISVPRNFIGAGRVVASFPKNAADGSDIFDLNCK